MPPFSKIWFNLGPTKRAGNNRSGIPRLKQQLLSGLSRLAKNPVEACVWDGNEFRSSEYGGKVGFQPGDVMISADFDWDVEYTTQIGQLRSREGVLTAGIIYDLITVCFPHFFNKNLGDRFRRLFMLSATSFDGVMAISKRTAADFEQFCSRYAVPCPPIEVITLGDCLPHATEQASLSVQAVTQDPFILFVSTVEKRKNHQVLLQAYHILRRFRAELDLPKLVFVGQAGWGVTELFKDIQLDP